jgi:MFS family permease
MNFKFLTDNSKRSLAPVFSASVISAMVSGLVMVCGLVLLFWPREPLSFYIATSSGPLLFFQTFSVTLIVLSHLNLRCGRGEMMETDFTRTFKKKARSHEEGKHFLRYGGLLFAVQTLFILFPFLPILMLASAVSGISALGFIQAISMIYVTVFLCRLFGFFAYLLWGGASVAGYLLVRGFATVYLLATAGFAPVVNPLKMIYELNKKGQQPETYLHYMLASISGVLILIIINTLLVNRRIKTEEMA